MKRLLRLCSNRKSRRELLSTSEASWATTKSVGMWRFLLHVLPRGFQRMRHFGFFANGRRKVQLPRCRELLGQGPVAPAETSPAVDATATASMLHPRSDACPVCRVGQMQVQETWFAQRASRDISHPVLVCDTS